MCLGAVHHPIGIQPTVPAISGIFYKTFTCFTLSFSHMINFNVASRRTSPVEVQSTIRVRKQFCIGSRRELGDRRVNFIDEGS